MYQKVYKFFLYFSIAFVLIIAFGLSVKLLTSACCWCDDVYFYVEDGKFTFKNLFLPLQQNNWFSTPLTRFFSFYLPKIFALHPSDFKSQYFSLIESSIFICFFTIWTSILYDKSQNSDAIKKIGFLHIFVFLFSFLFFYMQVQHQTMIIFLYEGLFRMIIPVFLSIFFIKQLVEKIEHSDIFNKSKCICLLLTLFLCLISNEMICFSLLAFLSLYFLSLLIQKKWNNDRVLNVGFIIVSFLSILICKTSFLRKSDVGSINADYFLNLPPMFSEFWEVFFQKVIVDHLVFYIIILVEIILLLIANNKNKINLDIIKVILFCFLGFVSFFFALFLLGKTYYNGGYWIEHIELHIMFNFILYAFILFLLKRLLVQFIQIKNILIIIFSLLVCFNLKTYYKNFGETYQLMKYFRMHYYKIEKILRRASLKDDVGYIDSMYLKDAGFFFFYNHEWDNSIYVKDSLFLENSLFITYMNSFENKNNFKKGYFFASQDTFSEELSKNDLIFTSAELRNPKFTKLFDDEFVLQELK